MAAETARDHRAAALRRLRAAKHLPKNGKPCCWRATCRTPCTLAKEDDDDLVESTTTTTTTTTPVDWSIERLRCSSGPSTDEAQFLVVTLHKTTPMQGLTLWWTRPLVDCAEIAPSTWSEESGTGTSSTSLAFQRAWVEAHEEFRERRKKAKTKG
jgi:hypothetical protein